MLPIKSICTFTFDLANYVGGFMVAYMLLFEYLFKGYLYMDFGEYIQAIYRYCVESKQPHQ